MHNNINSRGQDVAQLAQVLVKDQLSASPHHCQPHSAARTCCSVTRGLGSTLLPWPATTGQKLSLLLVAVSSEVVQYITLPSYLSQKFSFCNLKHLAVSGLKLLLEPELKKKKKFGFKKYYRNVYEKYFAAKTSFSTLSNLESGSDLTGCLEHTASHQACHEPSWLKPYSRMVRYLTWFLQY